MEIWKDIEGYENLYQISNQGRVKSLIKNIILKQWDDKDGYQLVGMSKDKKKKTFKVHRLVAQAFIPNPNNLHLVNHKDEDKKNNTDENLEWCDHIYNVNYGTSKERMTNNLKNNKENNERITKIGLENSKKMSKPVLQYTLDGEFVAEYPSVREASRVLGFSNTCIGACCNGKRQTHQGYKWKYKESVENELS